jgi:hypothetical protein
MSLVRDAMTERVKVKKRKKNTLSAVNKTDSDSDIHR